MRMNPSGHLGTPLRSLSSNWLLALVFVLVFSGAWAAETAASAEPVAVGSCPIEAEAAADHGAPPDTIEAPKMLGVVRDLSGQIDDDLAWRLGNELHEFYASGRTKPAYVLVVPHTAGEPIADYAQRVLANWGEDDNLDVDRSLLLVIATETRVAHVATGAGLGEKMAPGATEALTAGTLAPALRAGHFDEALTLGVAGIQTLIDAAIANKSLEDYAFEFIDQQLPGAVLALFAVSAVVAWRLAPVLGALVFGGVLGAGTVWYTADDVAALVAGGLGFVLTWFVFTRLRSFLDELGRELRKRPR